MIIIQTPIGNLSPKSRSSTWGTSFKGSCHARRLSCQQGFDKTLHSLIHYIASHCTVGFCNLNILAQWWHHLYAVLCHLCCWNVIRCTHKWCTALIFTFPEYLLYTIYSSMRCTFPAKMAPPIIWYCVQYIRYCTTVCTLYIVHCNLCKCAALFHFCCRDGTDHAPDSKHKFSPSMQCQGSQRYMLQNSWFKSSGFFE